MLHHQAHRFNLVTLDPQPVHDVHYSLLERLLVNTQPVL
jgi:hypothetical protein